MSPPPPLRRWPPRGLRRPRQPVPPLPNSARKPQGAANCSAGSGPRPRPGCLGDEGPLHSGEIMASSLGTPLGVTTPVVITPAGTSPDSEVRRPFSVPTTFERTPSVHGPPQPRPVRQPRRRRPRPGWVRSGLEGRRVRAARGTKGRC